MSDIFNEVFGKQDTRKQTPIEIVLGVDSQGMTTAKKLYAFLELDPSHYAKWFKKHILENAFAEESKDYWVFTQQCENHVGGRPTQDAKLTAGFAKKLSMIQKNEKGEEARKYFIQVEDGAKKMVDMIKETKQIPLTDHPGEVAKLLKVLNSTMKQEGIPAYKIAENVKKVCEQYGISVISEFVKIPEYEQMQLNFTKEKE